MSRNVSGMANITFHYLDTVSSELLQLVAEKYVERYLAKRGLDPEHAPVTMEFTPGCVPQPELVEQWRSEQVEAGQLSDDEAAGAEPPQAVDLTITCDAGQFSLNGLASAVSAAFVKPSESDVEKHNPLADLVSETPSEYITPWSVTVRPS